MTSKGHIAQDDFCFALGTEEEVLAGVVNQDIIAKIDLNKKHGKKHNMMYIISKLCIDEGNNDLQLWERYRPAHQVGGVMQLVCPIELGNFSNSA